MSFDSLFTTANISASGLSAERYRMEVVANNIANAFTTRTSEGGPYRRRDVIFEEVLNTNLRHTPRGVEPLGGVRIAGTEPDQSTEFPRILNPGHPDADANGYVTLPNVQLPLEMVNLITANRAYEANLKVLQAFRQQTDQALQLLRS
ncbi:MAG TPA: flagellar basal body rod protein FlgC [Gemmataceae bacterium]|nr:flagellar basal body rod protein FlgC [Gemmataceae bacterium]